MSETGTLVYGDVDRSPTRLTWLDRRGSVLANAGGPVAFGQPALSPDGKTIAVERVDPITQDQDLWLIDVARNVPSRFTSQGNNIIENVGTSTGWLMSDQQGIDPLLSPLGFYGGFGMTRLPLAASPAINTGQNCVTDLTCAAANPPVAVVTDQRGASRPFGASVDVGAVEASGDYYAVLPSSVGPGQYNFTIVPATNNFMYTVNGGGFGGLTLLSEASASLIGSSPPVGTYNALVLINGVAIGQVFQNYRLSSLMNLNDFRVTGRVLTSSGEPVSRAYVTFTGLNGVTYNAITNAFGYYAIGGLPAGLTGPLTISEKKGL